MSNQEIIFKLKSHDNEIADTCERVTKLEDIVKGDGKMAGLSPMTLAHEESLHGERGVLVRLRKLEDNALKTAGWVGGAVFVATILAQLAMTYLPKLLK